MKQIFVALFLLASTAVGQDLTLKPGSIIKFNDTDSSHAVGIKGPGVVSSNINFTLPAADGFPGQVLTTNGAGAWSWANSGTGSGINDGDKGDITVSGGGAVWSIDTGAVSMTELGLSDPNADVLLFWDDSANSLSNLSLGTNLSITGTTLNVTGVSSSLNNTNVGYGNASNVLTGESEFTYDAAGNTLYVDKVRLGSGVLSKTANADTLAFIGGIGSENVVFNLAVSDTISLTSSSGVNMWDFGALNVKVPTEVYDAAGWNGDLTVPTKDAVRDKIEAITLGNSTLTSTYVGYGDVTNVLTGEADFTYNSGTDTLKVGTLQLGSGSSIFSTATPTIKFSNLIDGEDITLAIGLAGSNTALLESSTGINVFDFGTVAAKVPQEVYDSTGWNGNLTAPTKDAVRDKVETLQPLDPDLTAIAALTTQPFGRSLLERGTDASTRTWINAAGLTANTFTGMQTVPTEVYGAGWNGSMTVPTKDALYDKIETLADPNTAVAWLDNIRQTFNPGSLQPGINVGSIAGDPSSPINGDLWYDSTANELTAHINGSNVALGAGGGSAALTNTYIGYGAGGVLSGEAAFTYDAGTNTMTVGAMNVTDLNTTNLNAGNLLFEGTPNDWETTLTVADPTADRTWTFPNETDTVVGLAATQTLTNKTLTSPTLATPTITGAITLPDNVEQVFNPGAANAGLNVGSIAGDPSAPNNGAIWYDSTANELTARINGGNVALGAGGVSSLTSTYVGYGNGSNALTGKSTFTFNEGTDTLSVTNFSIVALNSSLVNTDAIKFEGSTPDLFETQVGVEDPTADRTWTIPDVSDTFAGLAATQTLTNKTISLASNTLTATSAQMRTAISDKTGTGAAVFAGGDIGAATATTPAADDNDTSVATTAYVQGELAGLGGVGGDYVPAPYTATFAKNKNIHRAQPSDTGTWQYVGFPPFSTLSPSTIATVAPTATLSRGNRYTLTATTGSFGASGNTYWHSKKNWTFWMRVTIGGEIGTTERYWFGLCPSTPLLLNSLEGSIAFRFAPNASDTNWMVYSDDDDSAATVQSTGVTPAIDTEYFMVIHKTGTNINFYINGTQVGTTHSYDGTSGVALAPYIAGRTATSQTSTITISEVGCESSM